MFFSHLFCLLFRPHLLSDDYSRRITRSDRGSLVVEIQWQLEETNGIAITHVLPGFLSYTDRSPPFNVFFNALERVTEGQQQISSESPGLKCQ